MKKIIFISLLLLLTLSGCKNDERNNNVANNTVNYTKLSSNNNVQSNTITFDNQIDENLESNKKKEVEISSYTSKVLDKSGSRVNNLKIACSILNNHIVAPGETFSFNSVLGPSNKEKGYEQAKIFDSKGNVLKEYGGGICQISSTLYNAVEPCNVEIVERHKHSKRVYYVPENKDAAISYPSLDFKFKNNNQYELKIYAEANENTVIIKIYKID